MTPIEVTPKWTAVMPVLLAALTDGTAEGQRIARDELMRLARRVDSANDHAAGTRAALRQLIDAAATTDHALDADIFTDAPECYDAVAAAMNSLGALQGAMKRALDALKD